MNAKKLVTNKKTFRQAASFKRHAAKYSTHETILVICEGKTEVNYLNALKREIRLPSLTVEICKTGFAPINIVEYTIALVEDNEAIDQAYCVFDRDHHSTYLQAIDKLQGYQASAKTTSKATFTAITSTPCFEIWLLLHFNYTAKPYTQKGKISPCEQVQKELRKYLPEYVKNSTVISTAILKLARKKLFILGEVRHVKAT